MSDIIASLALEAGVELGEEVEKKSEQVHSRSHTLRAPTAETSEVDAAVMLTRIDAARSPKRSFSTAFPDSSSNVTTTRSDQISGFIVPNIDHLLYLTEIKGHRRTRPQQNPIGTSS